MTNKAFRNINLHQALLLLSLLTGLIAPAAAGQTFREFPPSLPPIANNNGGRVQSIAVSPINRNHIIAAHQFGGLWKTTNGGREWFHLGGLQAVWVRDVAYAADGQTVIATVARDTKVDSGGGGIWVSRNEGLTWFRPDSGIVRATASGLWRTGAFGISFAPDNQNQNKVYVGTDYGIAMSPDLGEHWHQQLINDSGPAVRSVQALPGNRVIAGTPRGVYLGVYSEGIREAAWRLILPETILTLGSDFPGNEDFKVIDVSPYDNDKVFILADYARLLLYEVAADHWTTIPMPDCCSDTRGPFVRAVRSHTGPPAIDLWVGLGTQLYKTMCPNFECVRTLRPSDWQNINQGLHGDCGYLGLDNQKRPVMYGSDGGLFKPLNPEATRWVPASPGGSGMNSYLISSLAGTNYTQVGVPSPSLYLATQDNNIWASPDGGRTWPVSDCSEGWLMQSWYQATTPRDAAARLAYCRKGCGHTTNQTSDANLLHQRVTPNIDRIGEPIVGHSFPVSLLSPGNWMHFVDTGAGSWGLYLSTDNLEHWQLVGTTLLTPSDPVFRASGPLASPTAYAAFRGTLMDRDDNPRVGLVRMEDVFHRSPTIVEENIIYLPNGGSLGQRATAFDWHYVFGVDPRNPDFLIAPDVVNQKVWLATRRGDDGRPEWESADELTNEVTKVDRITGEPRLFLYDGHPFRMQVTEIAFSPYERGLILVGTREAGIICSDDYGDSWRTIPGSEAMLYVTGFFFSNDGTVYASTYGRGLWKIDMRRRDLRLRPFSVAPICGFNYGQCIVRFPPDSTRNQIREIRWEDYNVLAVFGGRVNGLVRSGDLVKSITVTSGSSYRYYAVDAQAGPEINESKEGAGFQNDEVAEFALKNQEVITGVILKGNRFLGYLTNKAEFSTDQEPNAPKARAKFPADKPDPSLPYLSISTDSPIGPGLVQTGGTISPTGSRFDQQSPAELRLDGKTVAQIKVEKDGRFTYLLKVDEKLSLGQHRLEATQKTQKGERRAVATFVKVRSEDRFVEQRK